MKPFKYLFEWRTRGRRYHNISRIYRNFTKLFIRDEPYDGPGSYLKPVSSDYFKTFMKLLKYLLIEGRVSGAQGGDVTIISQEGFVPASSNVYQR